MDVDLIIIFLSLVFSAFFSGFEIAFISANRLKIELDMKKESWTGKALSVFYSNEQQLISAILLGNNIALVVFGIYFAQLFSPVIHAWGVTDNAFVLVIQTLVSTVLVLIVAEFLPKALFQLNPNRLVKLCAPIMWSIYWLVYLPARFVMKLSLAILRVFGMRAEYSEKVFSKVDLEHYVQDLSERIKDEQELSNEVLILQNALAFSKLKARDCMVPRPEIISCEVGESIEELKQLFIRKGISKVLIYRESIDNVIGYVHSYELYKKPEAIHQIMRSIAFVPEAIPGKELLEMFMKSASNIAVVVDEYGGTSGVVTIEDVIEKIFGDIEDEHDVEDWLEEQIDDYHFRFSARAEIDYLNDKYHLDLPESEAYETLGGLIIHELESIPELDEVVQVGRFTLHIEQVSDRRIEIVRLNLAK